MTKVKSDPRAELAKLQEFFDQKKAPLIEAVADLERQEAEKKALEAEKALAVVAEEIKPLAIYCIDLAEKADRALEEARKALVERQQVAGEIAAKSAKFRDRQVDVRRWHYERDARSGLNANGLLKFCRLDHHADGLSFVSQDVRNLSRWIDAKQMARASA